MPISASCFSMISPVFWIAFGSLGCVNAASIVLSACLLKKHKEPWQGFKVVKKSASERKKFILDESCSPKAKTPPWWNDYNSVKHNRTGKNDKHSNNYAKANLRNVFLAIAALYTLEVKLMDAVYRKGIDKKLSTSLESKENHDCNRDKGILKKAYGELNQLHTSTALSRPASKSPVHKQGNTAAEIQFRQILCHKQNLPKFC